jgi:cold shock CspA family protein
MHGTIARLVPERGFGFITDQDGRDSFFQRGALPGVDFEDLAPGEHPRATSIRLANDATSAPDHEVLPGRKTA